MPNQAKARTSKLLVQTLLELLETENFEKITIEEICDKAMIHRSTFYRHFPDKYALLETMLRGLFEELVVQKTEGRPVLDRLNHFILDHRAVVRHVSPMRQQSINLSPELFRMVNQLIADQIKADCDLEDPVVKIVSESKSPELMISLITGGVLGILNYYEESDFNLTQEELDDFLKEVFSKLH